MKLIDADALIKKWENVHSKDVSFEMAIIGATNDVKKAPTIDAVPVIRCKDCKYFELDHFDRVDFPTETGNAVSVPIITAHEICSKWSDGCKTSANGYCFMAERKEE